MTSKLVDTCNGLETLANYMWAAPGLTPADEDLLGTLKECGVNRDRRDDVKAALLQRRRRLEDKLVQLAGTLGTDSASWLLGPDIQRWAHLVARLRNSIAHGYQLPAGLSDDIPFTSWRSCPPARCSNSHCSSGLA